MKASRRDCRSRDFGEKSNGIAVSIIGGFRAAMLTRRGGKRHSEGDETLDRSERRAVAGGLLGNARSRGQEGAGAAGRADHRTAGVSNDVSAGAELGGGLPADAHPELQSAGAEVGRR